jgi:hypothetical protein
LGFRSLRLRVSGLGFRGRVRYRLVALAFRVQGSGFRV